MDIVRTTRCIICGGNPDMREDVELKVKELRQETKAGVVVRRDPPPKMFVEGGICRSCYGRLLELRGK